MPGGVAVADPKPAESRPRRPARIVLGFLVRFLLLYVVLILPWPAIVDAYAQGYRYVANGVAVDLRLDHKIWLRPNPLPNPANDSQIMRSQGGKEAWAFAHSTRYPAYATTAFLTALILATPTAWGHRIASLLWGLLILYQILAARIVITFLILDVDGPLPWQDEAPRMPTLFAARAGLASGSLWYVLATGVWALLMFRQLYAVVFASKEGPTDGDIPESWELIYLPLDEESAADRATRQKTIAETDKIYMDGQVLSPQRVEDSRFGPDGWQDEIQPEEEGDAQTAEEREEMTPEQAAAELSELAPEQEIAGSIAAVSDVLPNGAQIQQGVAIVVQVAAGTVPRDAGLAMLEEFYGLSKDRAEALMGSAGDGFTVKEETSDGLTDSQ